MSVEIEIFVIGKTDRWVFSKPHVRIGQDASCDLYLSKVQYSGAEGVQALIEVVNGTIRLVNITDNAFMNGGPARSGMTLSTDDTLRLGVNGPVIGFRLLSGGTTNAPTLDNAATRVMQAPGAYEATRVMQSFQPGHEQTRVMNISESAQNTMGAGHTTISSAPLRPNSGRYGYEAEVAVVVAPSSAERTTLCSPVDQRDSKERSFIPATPPSLTSTTNNSAEIEMFTSNLQALESKIKSMRALVMVNLVVIVALLGLVFQLQQELSNNSRDLRALRAQAQSAVGQFAPALDTRLNVFEQRMDGLDEKLKTAQDQMVNSMDAKAKMTEDRLVERMNGEIPRMLDKYIAQKMTEIKH
jgi:hypothetical protein